MRKHPIKIKYQSKDGGPVLERTIQAIVMGPFAIHKTIGGHNRQATWTITHPNTGMAIARARLQKSAVWAVREVLKVLPASNILYSDSGVSEIRKDKEAKLVGKFLGYAVCIANNMKLEGSVGIFYADRAELAKLGAEISGKPITMEDGTEIPKGMEELAASVGMI